MLVAAAAVVLGERQRREEREQAKEKESCRTLYERLVSHPLVAWIIENSCVVATTALGCLVLPAPRQGSFRSSFWYALWGPTVQVWLIMAAQKILTDGVYSHIPEFTSPSRLRPPFFQYVKEYLLCNAPVDLVNAIMLGSSIGAFDVKKYQDAFHRQWAFSPWAFLKKLAVARFIVDLSFWAGHRVLHLPSVYFLHRRHHGHFRPTLITNFHFAPLDLWVEGAMPLLNALILFDSCGTRFGRFELDLLIGYIVWHLTGSHAGKPVPTVTFFPPLAPLYQLLLGPVDRDNIKHHDVHHARLNCNYGITIWPDILMGTRVHDHTAPAAGAKAIKQVC